MINRKVSDGAPGLSDVLQPGRQMVAAGYALYGSATMIVLSLGNGVNGFTYDPSIGEFILTDLNMRIPDQGNIYSINEGYQYLWDDSVKQYIEAKKDPAKGKPYGARYVGSMVKISFEMCLNHSVRIEKNSSFSLFHLSFA